VESVVLVLKVKHGCSLSVEKSYTSGVCMSVTIGYRDLRYFLFLETLNLN